MRTRWLATLMMVMVGLAPALTRAAQAPHDASFSDDDCDNCHKMYVPAPAGAMDYSDSCLSCHANPNSRYGFPWATTDQAKPSFGGNQHGWSAYASKPSIGATPPISAQMGDLVEGKLQCSVCHDPHFANPQNVNNVPDTSIPLGAASPTSAATVSASASGTYAAGGAGNGQLAIMAAANGTAPQGWRIKVQTFSGTSGTFIISKNFGLGNAAAGMFWYTYQGGVFVRSAGTAADGSDAGAGKPFSIGNTGTQNVTLDDTGVIVRFVSGTAPKVGDYWDIWVSYPFLRMPVNQLCQQCHAAQVMGWQRVSGNDPRYFPDGVRTFSHPVGEGLNANGLNTDRTAANADPAARQMLDATGVAHGTNGADADGNATNDLALDASGAVLCTTCHSIHNADSNSLTKDKR